MRRYPKNGGQFAVIWTDLLYEDSVPDSAKLLYGEIFRLSDAEGWCDASNKDFMELLGCSETTVRNLLKSLVAVNQISIEYLPQTEGQGGTCRRIFCGRKLAFTGGGVPAEICGGTRRNLRGVPAENCGGSQYKRKNNNTPLPPTEVFDAIDAYIGDDPEYRAAFEGFLKNRAAMKKPIRTARAINTIINRLRKVNQRETEIAMLDKATELNWLTVYPLKPDELPSARPDPAEDEEGFDGI